jgi:putative component of membrane protein insertase Oxa1/YidC/SpoIIIJ protein YidD
MIRPATFNAFTASAAAAPVASAPVGAGVASPDRAPGYTNDPGLPRQAKLWSNPNPNSGSPYHYKPVPLDNASWLQKKCVAMIEWYQRNSLIHGSAYKLLKVVCPYGEHGYSSCSQYTKEAIIKYGVIKGIWKGLLHILHCNPWTEKQLSQGKLNNYLVA